MIKHKPRKHTLKDVNDYAYKRYYKSVKHDAALFWLNIHYCMGLSDREIREIGVRYNENNYGVNNGGKTRNLLQAYKKGNG